MVYENILKTLSITHLSHKPNKIFYTLYSIEFDSFLPFFSASREDGFALLVCVLQRSVSVSNEMYHLQPDRTILSLGLCLLRTITDSYEATILLVKLFHV